MVIEVDLKIANKFKDLVPLSIKTIVTQTNVRTQISEIQLSLPYSKVVQKCFFWLHYYFFFCVCSQIMATNPASSLVCLFILPQTQVVLFSF